MTASASFFSRDQVAEAEGQGVDLELDVHPAPGDPGVQLGAAGQGVAGSELDTGRVEPHFVVRRGVAAELVLRTAGREEVVLALLAGEVAFGFAALRVDPEAQREGAALVDLPGDRHREEVGFHPVDLERRDVAELGDEAAGQGDARPRPRPGGGSG